MSRDANEHAHVMTMFSELLLAGKKAAYSQGVKQGMIYASV